MDVAKQSSGKVKLNTLTIGDDLNAEYEVTDTPLFFPWAGQYFQELPLTLEAVPAAGYQFSHWEIQGQNMDSVQKYSSKITIEPKSDLEIIAVMIVDHVIL